VSLVSGKISKTKIRTIIKFFFRGEVYLALYIFAGTFKTVIPIQNYVDMTLLFFCLSIISAVHRITTEKFKLPKYIVYSSLFFLLLIGVILISFTYTIDFINTLTKSIDFIFLVGWAYIGSMLLIRSDKHLKNFLFTIVLLSISMIIDVSIKLINGVYQNNFVVPFNTNYLDFSRTLSISLIFILIFYVIRSPKTINQLIVGIGLSFLQAAGIVLSGARGPLLQIIATMSILPFTLIKFNRKKLFVIDKKIAVKLMFFFYTVLLTLVILFSLGAFDLFIKRMLVILDGNNLYVRFYMIDWAMEMWKQKPFLGWGYASYSYFVKEILNIENGGDTPHNLFLEFVSELGIVGLILLLTLISIASFLGIKQYFKLWNSERKYLQLVLVMILILHIIQTIFISSTSLAGRLTFCFIALAIASPWRRPS